MIIISALAYVKMDGQMHGKRRERGTLARGLRLPMASAFKSFLFFLHSTAVMMMIMSVTTAMGANTAAIIQRLLGGFFTTAEKGEKKTLFHHDHIITQHPIGIVSLLTWKENRLSPAKTHRSIRHTHAQ